MQYGPVQLEERGFRYVLHGGKRVELGRGASAIAFLCTDSHGEELVDKVIDAGKMTPDQRLRAQREAVLLQSVNHPHVLRCVDAWITEHRVLHIITERCHGATLRGRLEEQAKVGGPFPPDLATRWVAQLASALAHLHARSILHRDVKTDNVFLSADAACRLGDLGAARKLGEGEAMAATVAGTPYYFSPEICRHENYSSPTDVWSLGVVAFEICSPGRRPFDASSLPRLMRSITTQAPAPLPDHAPAALATLVGRMLEKGPGCRPSAAQVAAHPDLASQLAPELAEAAAADAAEQQRADQPAADPGGDDGYADDFESHHSGDGYEDDFEPFTE